MHAHSHATESGKALESLPPTHPAAYSPLPQRLITDLHDNPLAIGLYALIGRLYLIAQKAIPLSGPDIMRYDPSLSRGAIICALKRLVKGGWLLETTQTGMKTCYTPTWGRVRGTPLAWQMGVACLGRPRHVTRFCLDRRLLDVCMGKLTPHPTRAAPITRYITSPVLSLTDVGCYALTLAGIPHMTPALTRLGAVRNDQALPLPSDQRLLALISQRSLDPDAGDSDTTLTINGTRRLGIVPLLPPGPAEQSAQPLFFVPPDMIDSLIDPLIDSMIDYGNSDTLAPTAPTSQETRSDVRPEGITWESRDHGSLGITPPNPPQPHSGGGMKQQLSKRDEPTGEERPDTETATTLRAINVRPQVIAELADQPVELVRAVIADGRSRPQVRDLAGWVVAMVRDARDHGWQVLRAGDHPALDDADRQASFARAKATGLFVADDTPPATEQNQVAMPDHALIVAGEAPASAGQGQIVAFDPGREAAPVEAASITVAPIEDLTSRLQRELRARIYPDLHPIIAGLRAHDDGTTLTLRCASPTHLAVVRARLLPLIGPVLRELGGSRELRLATVACTAPQSATTEEEAAGRPAWIPTEQWAALPAPLRGALRGATLEQGAVCGATPYQAMLLQTRYVAELAALLDHPAIRVGDQAAVDQESG